METENIKSAVEAILFAAGEPVPTARISLILEVSEDEVLAAAKELSDEYSFNRRGIRILTLDNKLQMCSSPEYAAVISKTLEQRKPPMLSQPALETLAVVAYFQPVTRAYIDQVRGVDSSYTMGVSRLEDLPELPDISSGDGVKKLEDAIEKLNTVGNNQIRMEELK